MAEKEINNIIINYNDGTNEVINKGLVAEFDGQDENGYPTMTMHMCNILGKDLHNIVGAFVNLGYEIGMFNDLEGE